ncbi:ribbon-helix-helix domain-containing protein [Egbenema bharatensis]|uniref:ribbon-helix-helix domain-containing protein n=1 Tax=Egbenema bharatensis TaxID=3463334 RepID=UPI003A8B4B6C
MLLKKIQAQAGQKLNYDRTFSIRFTSEQLDQLDKLADKAGLTRSVFIRSVLQQLLEEGFEDD